MNYETLFNNIQAYAENTESLFVASIPVFVQEAEDRIYNSVNLPSLRKNVIGTATYGNAYLSLPDDWLANYSIAVIDSTGNTVTLSLSDGGPAANLTGLINSGDVLWTGDIQDGSQTFTNNAGTTLCTTNSYLQPTRPAD